MKENKLHCNNCGASLEDTYCSGCGQRASVHKVTLRETFEDLSSTLFSLEAPLFFTLKMLISKPGLLFRSYLSGKRKSYYKPITFFILSTVVFVLLRTLLDDDPYSNVPATESNKELNDFAAAARFMVKNINNILFVFVATMGISMKLFFYRKYRLIEYIAISFYLVSVYILIGSLLLPIMAIFKLDIKPLGMILMFVYFMIALMSFFQNRKFLNIVKIICTYLVALLLYVFAGYGLSLLIVKLQ